MHTRRYTAFISYRHADNTQEGRRWAEWLHRALERYTVPPDLIGTPNLRGEPIRDSLYPIFRDEDELPANADLATGIRDALEVSDHLIVLCSPRSAVSPWMRKEVREFKELGRSDRILAIIIAGEPNADDPAKAREGILRDEECFCEELRFGAVREDGTLDWTIRTEPLAADLRPVGTRAEGFVTAEAYREHLTLNSSLPPEKITALAEGYRQRLDHALLKVAAGLLGVPLGQLIDRDAAHRTALAEAEAAKQRWIAERERQLAEQAQRAKLATERIARRLAVAGTGALVLALLAGWFWRQAGQTQVEETRQRGIAEQRGVDLEAAAKEQEQLLHEASMADYAVAVQRIEKDGKWHEGVAHLARALKWEPGNRFAAARLYSTLSFYAPEKQTWPRLSFSHEDMVSSAQFSPDGMRIVTASMDGAARVWDATNGKMLGDPLRHEGEVNGAQFSPDGTHIVTASKDKTARLWDAMTGKPISEPMHHEDEVNGAQFSPDGTHIVTASKDKTARLWDATTGKPLGEPMHHEDEVNGAQFSPDGTRIVTASGAPGGLGEARTWNALSSGPLSEPMRHERKVYSAQFSPDGTLVVTASEDNTARVWDAASGKTLGNPLYHADGVRSARFSPDGTRIVTASDDYTTLVWDTAGHQRIEPIHHAESVLDAQFSPDGTRIVTASIDKTARVWDAMTGKALGETLHHKGVVRSVRFSPDGTRVVTASNDKTVKVWDAASGKVPGEPIRVRAGLLSAQFSPDGTRLVTASTDKTARLLDTVSGEEMGAPMRHEDIVFSAQFSPDGTRIVTACGDKTVWVWDAVSHKVLGGSPFGEPLRLSPNDEREQNSAQFSPDGTRIVSASADETSVRIRDAASGKVLSELLHHEGLVRSAQFSSDGKRIVTAYSDQTVQVWDATSGQPLGEPLRHEGFVQNVQFSPDGTRIVIASGHRREFGEARMWDLASGRTLGDPLRHEDMVNSAQFSPDGTRVVTACSDNAARVWDATSGKPLGEPLRQELGVDKAQFSPDGNRVVTVGFVDARVWDVSKFHSLPLPVANWMLDQAHAIAGLVFDADGGLHAMPLDVRLAILRTRPPDEGEWSALARWLVLPCGERSLTPDSQLTCRQIAERARDSETRAGIESSLRYDPTVPLSHILLAEALLRKDEYYHDPSDPQRAAFLRSYGLKLLPDDASLWTRASESLRRQGLEEAANQAAQKAASFTHKP